MKPRSSKSVTFSETSSMVLVADLASGPFKPDIWFTRAELDSFDANMKAEMRVVRHLIGSRRTPIASDILGMEKFLTHELTLEYRARRCKRACAVLNEARSQRWVCSRNPHGSDPFSHKNVARLAAVAAEGSRWARERARAAALFLEQDQEEERRRCLEQQRQVKESIKVENDERRRRPDQQRPAGEGPGRENDVRFRARADAFDSHASKTRMEWRHRSSLQAAMQSRTEAIQSRMSPPLMEEEHRRP